MNNLRPICIDDIAPVTPAEQPAPQLLWLEVTDLMIDNRYQRPLNRNNIAAIRRIAAEFQWSRFSPALVAPVEGGKYAIIDGQHRAHAAAACGFKRIPAMVVLVPPSEQAQAFIEINTRQIRVSAHNVLRAAMIAREPWAVAASEAVSAAGCLLMTTNRSTKDKKPGEIYAVALIRQMVESGKAAAVTAGLDALFAYDPTATANFSDALLNPWLGAVSATGQLSRDVLLRTLHAQRPWLVIDAADRIAKMDRSGALPYRRKAFIALINEQSK